uniref:GCV_T domain-containing protein n=1 Tax=Heterorhabditis bacteriophora TaxID=37862 RepID=A0A1I7WP16_HETBA
MSKIFGLSHRAVLLFKGPDSPSLLQGLLTNDIRLLSPSNGIAAFLLNNRGRIIDDLLLWRHEDDILVECSSSFRDDLKKICEKYRMRKKVDVVELNERVLFATNTDRISQLLDPRFPSFGSRMYGKHEVTGRIEDYHSLRRQFGIAEGRDELEGLLPFQANGDLLNMVSLDKGCYIGQELTARTAHTGVIRRRILPFRTREPVKGDVKDEHGKKVGQVISSGENIGIALLSLSSFSRPLNVGTTPIVPFQPSWLPNDVLRIGSSD